MSYAVTLVRRSYVGLGAGSTTTASATVTYSGGRRGAAQPAPAPAAPMGPDPAHSYAAKLGAQANANIQQFKAHADAAKQTAVDFAVSIGVPPMAFHALDSLSRGDNPRDVAVNLAASGARSLVAKIPTAQMATATGLTPNEVEAGKAILAGAVSGDISLGAVASIVGGAVGFAAGSALCGPLCGMVGGAVGTAIAGAITSLFTSKPPVDYSVADATLAKMKIHLEQSAKLYLAMENEVDTNVRYAAALAYNHVLEFHLDPVDDSTLKQNALTATGFAQSEKQFQEANGVTVSQAKVQPAREAFIQAVKSRVDAQYPGMWARDAVEAQYTLLQSRMLPANIASLLPGNAPEWRSMSDGGGGLLSEQPGSDVEGELIRTFGIVYAGVPADQRSHLYCHSGPGGEGADSFPDDADWERTPGLSILGCRDLGIGDEECRGHGDYWPGAYNRTDQAAYTARWECSLPVHLAWFRDVAGTTANQWTRVASRSSAIVALKAKQAAQQQIVNAVNTASTQVQIQAAKAAESMALLIGRRQQAATRAAVDAKAKMAAAQRAKSFMGGAISPTVVGVLVIGAGVAGTLYYLLRAPKSA
jgi:uncharacterized coiled-coil protein SlyX